MISQTFYISHTAVSTEPESGVCLEWCGGRQGRIQDSDFSFGVRWHQSSAQKSVANPPTSFNIQTLLFKFNKVNAKKEKKNMQMLQNKVLHLSVINACMYMYMFSRRVFVWTWLGCKMHVTHAMCVTWQICSHTMYTSLAYKYLKGVCRNQHAVGWSSTQLVCCRKIMTQTSTVWDVVQWNLVCPILIKCSCTSTPVFSVLDFGWLFSKWCKQSDTYKFLKTNSVS